MMKYGCIILVAVGSLWADPAGEGIPDRLPKPDKPLIGVYMGCRSTLDVKWKNFPRFEWCVDYFVRNPQKALQNINFIKKAADWMVFIENKVVEQVKKNKQLSAAVIAQARNDAQLSTEIQKYGDGKSGLDEGLPQVRFVPIGEINVDDTTRRAQNMMAGTVLVLEAFEKEVKKDKSLARHLGSVAFVCIVGAVSLGKRLYAGLSAIVETYKPSYFRNTDISGRMKALCRIILDS